MAERLPACALLHIQPASHITADTDTQLDIKGYNVNKLFVR